MSRWIVDASPLIFLAKLDRLQLLREAADEVLVPKSVLDEIQYEQDAAAALIDRATRSWLRAVSLHADEPEPRSGETAVIELGLELEVDRVVLDDLAARRLARARGLPVVGTLGLLLAARLRGEVASLAAEIAKLEAHGFRASVELVAHVLEEAGERP